MGHPPVSSLKFLKSKSLQSKVFWPINNNVSVAYAPLELVLNYRTLHEAREKVFISFQQKISEIDSKIQGLVDSNNSDLPGFLYFKTLKDELTESHNELF
jgi:hypothetical protein